MGNFGRNTDPCAQLNTRIPELPRIMRNNGWVVGAALMEKWLHDGANDAPKRGFHDTMNVRMDWVLMFGRASEVYQSAKAQKVWLSENAQKRIRKALIEEQSCLPSSIGDRQEIGNVGESQPFSSGGALQFHNDWQVQFSNVRQNPVTQQLDDLYAALGDFSFYYLVKGWVERLPDQGSKPRYRVTLNKVGVYVMDSYDFNDIDPETAKGNGWAGWLLSTDPVNAVISQPLGVWSCSRNYAGKNPFPLENKYYVQNRDFREWRKRYGKGRGGDFLVFSDIKVFDTNDSFEF